MKRKRIRIMTIVFIILCTVILYVTQSNKITWFNKFLKDENKITWFNKFLKDENKIAWFNKNSKDENNSNNVLKTENVANARDGIKGVTQPYPFITNPSGVENNLLQNANGSLIGQLIYLQRENLPEAEQKLLVNNKDATQYVLGYLAGQEATPFEQGETVEINRKFPYYIQWDKRWAYDKLGGTNVAIGGCGPTCVAMALSGILDDK